MDKYEDELLRKSIKENGAAWCGLYYQFAYNIEDKEIITVGERDSQIENMINVVQAFWSGIDIKSAYTKETCSGNAVYIEKFSGLSGRNMIKYSIKAGAGFGKRMPDTKKVFSYKKADSIILKKIREKFHLTEETAKIYVQA